MHKLPTKAEKHKIYKRALEIYHKSPNVSGMCWAIVMAQRDLGFKTSDNPYYSLRVKFLLETSKHEPENNMENNFPEIFQYKPKSKKVNEFWWDVYNQYGQKKRIAILTAAQEACKPIKRKL
jgi:hypothetical protein